jgi:hypothetical protein
MQENPLKHYFRRPAIYIRLPSGGVDYSDTVLEKSPTGELPVYPMSALDEITARTPDALFNGHAVVDIIKSCIPSIRDPWGISTVDMDAIFIGIRIASSGETMDILCSCPKCNTEGKYGLNMVSLLGSRKNIDYSKTLRVRDMEIKFRPLTFAESNKNSLDQYEAQKLLAEVTVLEDEVEKAKQTKHALEYLNNLTIDIITSTIEWIKTPEVVVGEREFIKEFILNCDRQTSTQIRDFSIKLREDATLPPMQVKCSDCGNEYEQPLLLNMSDFFE